MKIHCLPWESVSTICWENTITQLSIENALRFAPERTNLEDYLYCRNQTLAFVEAKNIMYGYVSNVV